MAYSCQRLFRGLTTGVRLQRHVRSPGALGTMNVSAAHFRRCTIHRRTIGAPVRSETAAKPRRRTQPRARAALRTRWCHGRETLARGASLDSGMPRLRRHSRTSEGSCCGRSALARAGKALTRAFQPFWPWRDRNSRMGSSYSCRCAPDANRYFPACIWSPMARSTAPYCSYSFGSNELPPTRPWRTSLARHS
jgi:hypothetical protein